MELTIFAIVLSSSVATVNLVSSSDVFTFSENVELYQHDKDGNLLMFWGIIANGYEFIDVEEYEQFKKIMEYEK